MARSTNRIVSINLPRSTVQRLDARAKAESRSRSNLVGRALSDWLKQPRSPKMAETPHSTIEGTLVRSPFTNEKSLDTYSPAPRQPTSVCPANSKEGVTVNSPFNRK
jgi:hypothetical protein